jgi:hypothetical protein
MSKNMAVLCLHFNPLTPSLDDLRWRLLFTSYINPCDPDGFALRHQNNNKQDGGVMFTFLTFFVLRLD